MSVDAMIKMEMALLAWIWNDYENIRNQNRYANMICLPMMIKKNPIVQQHQSSPKSTKPRRNSSILNASNCIDRFSSDKQLIWSEWVFQLQNVPNRIMSNAITKR